MKNNSKFLSVSQTSCEVFIVIQEKAIFHDESSAAPYYSKTIVGIFFSKKEATDKRKEIISKMKDNIKYCYVFIETHNII